MQESEKTERPKAAATETKTGGHYMLTRLRRGPSRFQIALRESAVELMKSGVQRLKNNS